MSTTLSRITRSTVLALLAVTWILAAGQARPAAAGVEFTFWGVVLEVGEMPPPPWQEVHVGDAFRLTYCFQETLPDQRPSPELGVYTPMISWTLQVGAASDGGSSSGVIQVRDRPLLSLDRYLATVPAAGGSQLGALDLRAFVSNPFSSDALPLCGDVDLADFQSRSFTIRDQATSDVVLVASVDVHACGPCPALPVEPGCTDFDDGELDGFTGQNVTLSIDGPGPSGDPTDLYLKVEDDVNASRVFAGPDFLGDWSIMAADGCARLCFDVRVFDDGDSGSHRDVTPGVAIESSAGVGARFTASFTISEDGGANPGWHRVCAPLAPLDGGQLPSGPDGSWSMIGGAPVTDWDGLLADVAEVRWGVFDISLSQDEVVGYDNICLIDEACGCAVVESEELECDPAGDWTYELTFTNQSGVPVNYVLVDVGSPAGVTVEPNVVFLDPPLADGATITLDPFLVHGAASGDEVCLRFILMNTVEGECCRFERCFTNSCCLEELEQGYVFDSETGQGTLTLVLDNVSGFTISKVYLLPEPGFGVTVDPDDFDLSVPPGDSFTLTTTVTGAGTGFWLTVTAHDEDLDECCAVTLWIDVGPLPGPLPFPGPDLDSLVRSLEDRGRAAPLTGDESRASGTARRRR